MDDLGMGISLKTPMLHLRWMQSAFKGQSLGGVQKKGEESFEFQEMPQHHMKCEGKSVTCSHAVHTFKKPFRSEGHSGRTDYAILSLTLLSWCDLVVSV